MRRAGLALAALLLPACGKPAAVPAPALRPVALGPIALVYEGPLMDLAGWTHRSWETYDAAGGSFEHAATGIHVEWILEGSFGLPSAEQVVGNWLSYTRLSVDGTSYYLGQDREGRHALFREPDAILIRVLAAPEDRLGEILGLFLTRWKELRALGPTPSVQK